MVYGTMGGIDIAQHDHMAKEKKKSIDGSLPNNLHVLLYYYHKH